MIKQAGSAPAQQSHEPSGAYNYFHAPIPSGEVRLTGELGSTVLRPAFREIDSLYGTRVSVQPWGSMPEAGDATPYVLAGPADPSDMKPEQVRHIAKMVSEHGARVTLLALPTVEKSKHDNAARDKISSLEQAGVEIVPILTKQGIIDRIMSTIRT